MNKSRIGTRNGDVFAQAIQESGGDASHAAYLAIVAAAASLQGQVAALLSAFGLSLTQYSALRAVRRQPGLHVAEMADAMVHRAPDASRLCERLERMGLVHRRPDPENRRATTLSLTEDGEQLLARIDAPMLELHRAQFSGLDPARRTDIVDALRAVAG